VGHGRDVYQIVRLENDEFWVDDAIILSWSYQIQLGSFAEHIFQIGPVVIVYRISLGIAHLGQSLAGSFLCPNIYVDIIPLLNNHPHTFTDQQWRNCWCLLCREQRNQRSGNLTVTDKGDKLTQVLQVKQA